MSKISRHLQLVPARCCLTLTDKSLSNSFVTNETTVSVVRVTFGESLIDREQVQVDSIMQVKLYNVPITL